MELATSTPRPVTRPPEKGTAPGSRVGASRTVSRTSNTFLRVFLYLLGMFRSRTPRRRENVSRCKQYCEHSQRTNQSHNGRLLASYTSWHKLLEEYTLASLTKGTDRFPAILGLANTVSNSINDEYVAGIFLRGLIVGLLWTTKSYELPVPVPRLQSGRAPSWSWASVEGLVRFVLCSEIDAFREEPISLATYCSHQTKMPSNTTATGTLTISPPLFPVKSIPENGSHKWLADFAFIMLHLQGFALYIRAMYDFPYKDAPTLCTSSS